MPGPVPGIFVFGCRLSGGALPKVSRSATARLARINVRHAGGTKRRRIAANRPCRRGERCKLCVGIPAHPKAGGRPLCPRSVNGAQELTFPVERSGRGAGRGPRRRPAHMIPRQGRDVAPPEALAATSPLPPKPWRCWTTPTPRRSAKWCGEGRGGGSRRGNQRRIRRRKPAVATASPSPLRGGSTGKAGRGGGRRVSAPVEFAPGSASRRPSK